jgi:hypothetical protein
MPRAPTYHACAVPCPHGQRPCLERLPLVDPCPSPRIHGTISTAPRAAPSPLHAISANRRMVFRCPFKNRQTSMEGELDDDHDHDHGPDLEDDESIPRDEDVVFVTARGILTVLPDQCARHIICAIPLTPADMANVRRIGKPGYTLEIVAPSIVPAFWRKPRPRYKSNKSENFAAQTKD